MERPSESEVDTSTEEKRDQEKSVVEDGKTSPNESEYDSAGSYSDEEQHKAGGSPEDSDGASRTRSASEGSVGIERESGDGQESLPQKKIDDDEDKKNPQYIPKRGTFYEHDDRTADEPQSQEAEPDKDKDSKKKLWQDKKERWSHDRFNDSEQAPKSRSELVAIYGYDIRNEDGPPRARRRRRYGRGPNKYTRNWEDEDAYNKPAPTRPKKPPAPTRKSNRDEDFPPLGSPTEDEREQHSRRDDREREDPRQQQQRDSGREREDNRQQNRVSGREREDNRQQRRDSGRERDDNRQPHLDRNNEYQTESDGNVKSPSASGSQDSSRPPIPDSHSPRQQPPQQQQQQQQQQQRIGSGRVVKPKREIKDSDYRGFTAKTRQVRNLKTDQKVVPKNVPTRNDFIQSQNFTNKNNLQQQQQQHDLEKEMSKLSVKESSHKGYQPSGSSNTGGQRQGSVPPRLQNEQKGSKRYSSMRQRSLPESATPPFNQHPNYYPNEYSQQGPVMHQSPQIHPSAAQVPQIAPPPLPPIPQVPVTATPILQAAPQFAPPFAQAPPPFLQPGVAPPAFIPQQTPQIINYVPSQPQFPPQGYQGYQQQFNPVTQPELYQPQPTGITYYSTDQQVTTQRAAPQKRPKVAIPIVAPPPLDFKVSRQLKDGEDILHAPPEYGGVSAEVAPSFGEHNDHLSTLDSQ